MGNCQKREELLTVTNFDEDKWQIIGTNMSPNCFILKNYSHPHVRLFKWIANSNSSRKISQWRQQNKPSFCASIYESGETGKYSYQFYDGFTNQNWQKRRYIITEELIRLKDLSLIQDEAVIISEQCLRAFQEMICGVGGFVARQGMIFLNRQGLVKVWLNENLANDEKQFEYPNIKESEFICSILHQIFTRCNLMNGLLFYENLKNGQINFGEILGKLNEYIIRKNLLKEIIIQKQIFNKVIRSYEIESKGCNILIKQKNYGKGYKYLVADDNCENPDTFVRDYSRGDRKGQMNSRSEMVKGRIGMIQMNENLLVNNVIWQNLGVIESFSG